MRREHDLHGRRRGRNWAVLAGLAALVVLLFAVTLVKLGPDAYNPSTGASWGQSLVTWLRGDQPQTPPAAPARQEPAR